MWYIKYKLSGCEVARILGLSKIQSAVVYRMVVCGRDIGGQILAGTGSKVGSLDRSHGPTYQHDLNYPIYT